jgi:phenylacetate-CoA ligase
MPGSHLRSIQETRFKQLLAEGMTPFLRTKWTSHHIDVAGVRSLEDLPKLPFTCKEELVADQAAHPPYGSNLSRPFTEYVRLHQTSGTTTGQPLCWLDTAQTWDWVLDCWQKIYDAVGVVPADRCFFPFSFGPFLGFWAAFEGAARRGCLVLPGGGASSVARLRFLLANGATIVFATPTYALRLVEVAHEEGLDLPGSSVRMLILAGEPGGNIPSTRHLIEKGWGARVIDHWGMTEVGPLGVECAENPGGFHILEEDCLAEVIDPHTTKPAAAGMEGELVITTLGRFHSPAVRYRTGDRVRVDPKACPCGRLWKRLLGGILGRTDEMLLIKGNNIYPSMIEAVVRSFSEIEEFQIVVDNRRGEKMVLRLELKPGTNVEIVSEGVSTRMRDDYHLRPDIECVSPGTLPRSEMKSKRVVRIM